MSVHLPGHSTSWRPRRLARTDEPIVIYFGLNCGRLAFPGKCPRMMLEFELVSERVSPVGSAGERSPSAGPRASAEEVTQHDERCRVAIQHRRGAGDAE